MPIIKIELLELIYGGGSEPLIKLALLGKSLAAARVLGLSVARAGALLIRRYS